jgi:hypothetical protein
VSDTTASDYAQPPNVIYITGRLGGAKPPGPPLQPPGGGGTSDGMLEARVASLEAEVKNIRENVGEIRVDLKSAGQNIGELKVNYATVAERMSHLPTKGYIGWWITGGIAVAVTALTLLSKLGFLVAGAPK